MDPIALFRLQQALGNKRWRDPVTVDAEDLRDLIAALEEVADDTETLDAATMALAAGEPKRALDILKGEA